MRLAAGDPGEDALELVAGDGPLERPTDLAMWAFSARCMPRSMSRFMFSLLTARVVGVGTISAGTSRAADAVRHEADGRGAMPAR
jgi:hypothetical protein